MGLDGVLEYALTPLQHVQEVTVRAEVVAHKDQCRMHTATNATAWAHDSP